MLTLYTDIKLINTQLLLDPMILFKNITGLHKQVFKI